MRNQSVCKHSVVDEVSCETDTDSVWNELRPAAAAERSLTCAGLLGLEDMRYMMHGCRCGPTFYTALACL